MPEYTLVYFPIRGLAEQARLLLTDNGVPFTDKKIAFDQWKEVKPTMQFGQVPCLFDGDMQVCQSGAIMRHLARAHGLYGASEADATFADLVFEGVKDLHSKYTTLVYQTWDTKKDEFVNDVLPVELAKFEALVKSKNPQKQGLLLGGDKPCFTDYTLYEELDIMQKLDKNCLAKFPSLTAYYKLMHARPNLQEYISSEERKKMFVNGNDKGN